MIQTNKHNRSWGTPFDKCGACSRLPQLILKPFLLVFSSDLTCSGSMFSFSTPLFNLHLASITSMNILSFLGCTVFLSFMRFITPISSLPSFPPYLFLSLIPQLHHYVPPILSCFSPSFQSPITSLIHPSPPPVPKLNLKLVAPLYLACFGQPTSMVVSFNIYNVVKFQIK